MRNELATNLSLGPKPRATLLTVGVAVVLADLAVFTRGETAHSPWRLGMGLGVLIVFVMLCRGQAAAVGLRGKPQPSLRYWGVTVLVLALLSVVVLTAGGAWLWYRRDPLPSSLFREPADMWPAFRKSVLLAPLSEELVYRLALCAPLAVVLGAWRAILVSGVVFAYLHHVYGNFALNHVAAGFILGWSYVRSGCLWVPILLHALGNLQVFALNVALWWWAHR